MVDVATFTTLVAGVSIVLGLLGMIIFLRKRKTAEAISTSKGISEMVCRSCG